MFGLLVNRQQTEPWRESVLVRIVIAASCLALTSCTNVSTRASDRSLPRPTAPGPQTPTAPRTANPATLLTPRVISFGPRTVRAVALTFDADLTAYMGRELDTGKVRSFDNAAAIDELIRLRVPATFFLTGLWMLRYPAETRRLAGNPLFEVGTHSYEHRAFTPRCYGLGTLAPNAMAADIERAQRVLRRLDPHPSDLFRFPGGCFDDTALKEVAAARVQIVEYDVAGGDAFSTSVSSIVRTTLRGARPGAIIVLHINGGNTAPKTALALPGIISGLRMAGYRLETVSELLHAGVPQPAPVGASASDAPRQ